MADEVMEEFGDPQGNDLSREQVYNYLRGGVRKTVTQLFKSFPDYLKTYTTQALTSGTATYALPSGFLGFIRVDINIGGTATTDAYKAIYKGEDFGEPDTTFYKSSPYVSIRGNYFVVRPTPDANGMAFIWYWASPTTMTTESSEHGLPYGARDVLVNYALYRAWLGKDQDKSTSYKTLFTDSLDDYMDFVINSRQTMTKGNVEIITGGDLYEF
jgi:hypothetical protein